MSHLLQRTQTQPAMPSPAPTATPRPPSIIQTPSPTPLHHPQILPIHQIARPIRHLGDHPRSPQGLQHQDQSTQDDAGITARRIDHPASTPAASCRISGEAETVRTCVW
ncbi:unnamed protein product [Periconia digitata]|uniref:Uncharacterized protein n=1 Tax=Periconia digitata TaxID=1303443 RepID=A0A9W4U6X6_9PLEO|nr:unnamed protein product [Periconia digitata]